jgi:hypothetical protein
VSGSTMQVIRGSQITIGKKSVESFNIDDNTTSRISCLSIINGWNS